MKLSDIGKKLTDLIEFGSHMNTTFDVLGAMRGKEPSENAPAIAKGLYGVLGYGDERTFEVLLHDLENKHPGSREILTGFFQWHFKTGTATQKYLSWWYGNAFRSFVTRMGSSAGHIEGNKVTTETCTDASSKKEVKVVTTKEIRGDGTNNALNFLMTMVTIIKSTENESGPNREDGYKKLLEQFKSFGYPHIPDDAESLIGSAISSINTGEIQAKAVASLTNVNDALKKSVDTRRNEQSWFTKLLKKI